MQGVPCKSPRKLNYENRCKSTTTQERFANQKRAAFSIPQKIIIQKSKGEISLWQKQKLKKITDIQERIAQLENQKKKLVQEQKDADRRARTKRLCKRHGLLESMLPEIAGITDEQYKSLIEKAVDSKLFRDMLDAMTAIAEDIIALDAELAVQGNDADNADNSTAPPQSNTKPQPAGQPQNSDDKHNANAPNSNTQSSNPLAQKPHNNGQHRNNQYNKPNGNDTRQSS